MQNLVILIGTLMGLAFWIFDSFTDALMLGEGTFISQMFSPGPVEIWIRSFVFLLFIVFSIIMAREFRKRKQLYLALQKSEESLRKTAKENELLLHEIHHRVKNNMQVMSSICRLQSKQIEDEKALNVLRNSSSRIRAMAYVHEHLYRNHNLSEVETGTYLNSLATSIFQVFEIEPETINFTSSVENIQFGPDTLITLGLVLNELISNSIKHAFTDTASPEISLKLFRDDKGRNNLVYRDNGSGMTEEFSASVTDSLGHFLIESFVQRLDGTIQVSSSDGTAVHITF